MVLGVLRVVVRVLFRGPRAVVRSPRLLVRVLRLAVRALPMPVVFIYRGVRATMRKAVMWQALRLTGRLLAYPRKFYAFLADRILSGAFPLPWLLVILFVSSLPNWTLLRLELRSLTGGNVKCKLCDAILAAVMDTPNVDCASLCPPFGQCASICRAVLEAVESSSSRFPCASVCDVGDECKLSAGRCLPSALCRRRHRIGRWWRRLPPVCESNRGLAVWNKYEAALTKRAATLASAFAPQCAALPQATTVPKARSVCDVASVALVAVVATLRSIRSVDSDSARIWLLFWVALALATYCEWLFDVSELRYYCETKAVAIAWLTLGNGAVFCYRRASRCRLAIAHSRLWRRWFRRGAPVSIDAAENAALGALEREAKRGGLSTVAQVARSVGVVEAYRTTLRCRHGEEACDALLGWLEQQQYAFVSARLRFARLLDSLPDSKARCYGVLQLEPPREDDENEDAANGAATGWFFAPDGTAQSAAVKTREEVLLEWNEDLEVRLLGGTVDPSTGRFRNPNAPYSTLRVQLWRSATASTARGLLGEAAVPLADIMHGVPTSFDALPLFEEGHHEQDEDDDEDEKAAPFATVSLTLQVVAS